MSTLDKLRDFISTFPRWADYGIAPPDGQIAAEYFRSADDLTQLALRLDGSSVTQTERDILESVNIQRRNSYTLFLLKSSGTSPERADTSAFFEDFIEWTDESDVRGTTPQFGDDPDSQQVSVEAGTALAPWDGGRSMVYALRIHITYTKHYEREGLY